MSIPVIREVTYTDDGCTLYECLNCYKKIESRSGGFHYCPYCGCKFEYGFVSKQKEFWDEPRFRTHRIRICQFVLWERFKWKDEDSWSDWKKETEGHIEWVLRRKKEICQMFLEDDPFCSIREYKFTVKT